jgi:hypothetical protein
MALKAGRPRVALFGYGYWGAEPGPEPATRLGQDWVACVAIAANLCRQPDRVPNSWSDRLRTTDDLPPPGRMNKARTRDGCSAQAARLEEHQWWRGSSWKVRSITPGATRTLTIWPLTPSKAPVPPVMAAVNVVAAMGISACAWICPSASTNAA